MAGASGSRRVVIVGGGLAGLFAARALRSAPPLLYQCATGILSEGKIAYPLRHLVKNLRNLEFEIAEVTGLDARQPRVLARRPLGEQMEFGYDYLILAAGQIIASYYNFLRLGHEGYRRIHQASYEIGQYLAAEIVKLGPFEPPAARCSTWPTDCATGAGRCPPTP